MKKIKNSRIPSVIFLGLGILMIALGVYREEISVVLAKATSICMECIGIG